MAHLLLLLFHSSLALCYCLLCCASVGDCVCEPSAALLRHHHRAAADCTRSVWSGGRPSILNASTANSKRAISLPHDSQDTCCHFCISSFLLLLHAVLLLMNVCACCVPAVALPGAAVHGVHVHTWVRRHFACVWTHHLCYDEWHRCDPCDHDPFTLISNLLTVLGVVFSMLLVLLLPCLQFGSAASECAGCGSHSAQRMVTAMYARLHHALLVSCIVLTSRAAAVCCFCLLCVCCSAAAHCLLCCIRADLPATVSTLFEYNVSTAVKRSLLQLKVIGITMMAALPFMVKNVALWCHCYTCLLTIPLLSCLPAMCCLVLTVCAAVLGVPSAQ